MIEHHALHAALAHFHQAQPFAHTVVDGFFRPEVAQQLAAEFLPYDSERWFVYDNPLEQKKALNDWHAFPPLTYQVLTWLNSPEFIAPLAAALQDGPLLPDPGLHGGGWHIHAAGGKLNPHLDYSIHPKLGLQRKLNLIIYLSPHLQEEDGGHLGLWQNDASRAQPGALVTEIAPRFNRAVLFDTRHHAWHGMSRALHCPPHVFRQSLAVYYLGPAPADADPRARALYAPSAEQTGDAAIADLIARRAASSSAAQVYRSF